MTSQTVSTANASSPRAIPKHQYRICFQRGVLATTSSATPSPRDCCDWFVSEVRPQLTGLIPYLLARSTSGFASFGSTMLPVRPHSTGFTEWRAASSIGSRSFPPSHAEPDLLVLRVFWSALGPSVGPDERSLPLRLTAPPI